MENCSNPVQFFLQLFGTDTIQLITEQTNICRAAEEIARNKPILPILQSEIRQVLGILMYMSVVSLPIIKHYWNRTLRIEAVAETMLRDRFLTINRLLHLSNNNLQPTTYMYTFFNKLFLNNFCFLFSFSFILKS